MSYLVSPENNLFYYMNGELSQILNESRHLTQKILRRQICVALLGCICLFIGIVFSNLTNALLSGLNSLFNCLDLSTSPIEVKDFLMKDLVHNIKLELLDSLYKLRSMVERSLFLRILFLIPNLKNLIV